MEILKIKLLKDNIILPKRATDGSAGYDIYANLENTVIIKPKQTVSINTGFCIELESNKYVAHIYSRSGISIKHGITLPNSVGVIDSDYRGEIIVALHNNSDKDFKVENGDRIAQLIILPVFTPEIKVIESLSETIRNNGGFGSTGIK